MHRKVPSVSQMHRNRHRVLKVVVFSPFVLVLALQIRLKLLLEFGGWILLLFVSVCS